jgi:uncharacterized protein (DUF58 family)
MKQSRILYLCLFLSTLVFIYFYGGKVPYMLFYTVVLLPVVSLSYTAIVFFRFKYCQDIDKRFVTKGDRLNFIFSISNEDFFLYPYIRVSFYGAKTIFANQFQVRNFSLTPFRGKSYSLELVCNYRGNYEIGINSVEIGDFLGLFSFKYNIFAPKFVTVYPRIVRLDRFFLKTDFMSDTHSVLNTKNEDMSTISDVRKYSYGDSLKRVHWKLTAKSGNIMVKKFQSTSETSAIMLLDLHGNTLENGQNIILEDKLIEAVVSVLHYCLFNWIPINLVYFSERLFDIHAKNHLMFSELYEILAKVKFNETVQMKDLLKVYVNNTISKTNILLFTSNLDYELYNEIYKTSISGFDVSLIYVSSENLTGIRDEDAEKIIAFLPEIGVTTYRLNIDDDTKCVLEQQ